MSVVYSTDAMARFSCGVFEAVGLSSGDASIVTNVLLHADLRGHASHGLTRIPIYAERIKAGVVKAAPQVKFERTAPSFLHVDGDNGPGPVVSERALDAALAIARENGVCAAAIAHSNHNGAGSYYVEKAVAAGCIAIWMTNAPPSMTVFGGREPVIGTNPITFGTPILGDTPLLMDMATSVVARGKIVEAAKRGETIPEGWALDANGKPTTSGVSAEKGVVLPLSGAKGSALAIMVEVLCGALSGGRFAGSLGNLYSDFVTPQDIGHFLLLIDVSKTHVGTHLAERVRDLVTELKACATADGFDAILMPGEIEKQREQKVTRTGIALPENVLADLHVIARTVGAPPLPQKQKVAG
ncbi:Ldh family oxidoreductase [Pararhizobium haloflavum]|uniref:Ldh family oxidoreductase n=1 Tax=Pararhizobium haloflavum TaxID=2037914 RepID=UPI000C179D7E|nr:Ldh family oxidoreductase [Pararhizobium haloflavum]